MTNLTLNQIFGYLSGLAITLSFVPYIQGIWRQETKPERASWLIWAILGSISFLSQWAKGASDSLILTGAQTIGDLLIFILAIKYGVGGWLRRDQLALAGVVVGLGLWYVTNDALWALFIAILIDGTGALLTILKTYEQPTTETVSAWVFTFLGGLFACLAVGSWNLVLLAFPFYVCLASLGVLGAVWLGGRERHKLLIKA